MALSITFIGGGASTVMTLCYLIRDLKRAETERPHEPVRINVFDPKGLNAGLAYSTLDEAVILNQPAGADMDPFDQGGSGLPLSFLNWCRLMNPGQRETDFLPRKSYGHYIQHLIDHVQTSIADLPNVSLSIKPTLVVDIQRDRDCGYYVTGQRGPSLRTQALVLATGHVVTPRIQHDRYLAANGSPDYTKRLQEFSACAKEIVLIGSGASMVEAIATLEGMSYRGRFRSISRHGATGWHYEPGGTPLNEHQQAMLRHIVNEVVSQTSAARWNETDIVEHALRQVSDHGIGAVHLIVELIKNESVLAHPELSRKVQAYYGNPLPRHRIQMLQALSQNARRLTYHRGYVCRVQPDGGGLTLELADGPSLKADYVVDCAITGRGVVKGFGDTDALLKRLAPRSEGGSAYIAAIGAASNALKSGIASFVPGFRTTARTLCHQAYGGPSHQRAIRSDPSVDPSFIPSDFC